MDAHFKYQEKREALQRLNSIAHVLFGENQVKNTWHHTIHPPNSPGPYDRDTTERKKALGDAIAVLEDLMHE